MLPEKRTVQMRWNPAKRLTIARRLIRPYAEIRRNHPRILPLAHERAKARDFLKREKLRLRLSKATDAARGITTRTKIQNYDEWLAGAKPIRRELAPREKHGPRDKQPDPKFLNMMIEALGYARPGPNRKSSPPAMEKR